VLEFEEEGRNIVVSRRAMLEEEKKARIEELKASLAVGMEVTGVIRSLQKFGAFIDLGGIDGLIPMSELSWVRNEKIENVLAVGQEVRAKILSLDWERNRLSLSLKALQPDPWALVAEQFQVGAKVSGTIVRLAPFGAFVNVAPGIDGLVHISNLGAGRRINHPKEVVETGQAVEAYVLAVDRENRKLSLSLQPKAEPVKVVPPAVGALVDGTVDKVMPFGIFLKLEGGATGLVPNAEAGTPAGTDHTRMFPAGSRMQVVVIEVDSENKVRLSRKRVMEKVEQDEFDQYKDSVKKTTSSGLGNLGELLKAKMEEKGLTGRS
jgi:small subunit ribosomal protein S1